MYKNAGLLIVCIFWCDMQHKHFVLSQTSQLRSRTYVPLCSCLQDITSGLGEEHDVELSSRDPVCMLVTLFIKPAATTRRPLMLPYRSSTQATDIWTTCSQSVVSLTSARAQVAGKAGPEVQPRHVLARPKRTVPEFAHAYAYVRSQRESPRSSCINDDCREASYSHGAA